MNLVFTVQNNVMVEYNTMIRNAVCGINNIYTDGVTQCSPTFYGSEKPEGYFRSKLVP